MLKIAVCDDELRHLDKINELLRAYLQARPSLSGKVFQFESGASMLNYINDNECFDLYILDILMPEIDGIQTGRRLRDLGCGGEIIFLTASNEFASESYEVRAFFYLLKPVDKTRLFSVLDRAIEKLNQRRTEAIMVGTPDGPRRILLESIRYVERASRVMRYHCTDGIVDSSTIRIPFGKMAAPLLTDSRFYLGGVSYVLNFQHVAGVDGQTVLLDSGEAVTLPRTVAGPFKQAWGKYWLEESTYGV